MKIKTNMKNRKIIGYSLTFKGKYGTEIYNIEPDDLKKLDLDQTDNNIISQIEAL
jgi:hypothetical protein